MNNHTVPLRRLFAVTIALLLTAVAFAQKSGDSGKGDETRQQIEDRLEKRYPKLFEAEEKGKVGENAKGFVEAVQGRATDGEIKKLIDDENADRKKLYEILAAENKNGEKVSAAEVGERNAIRKFQKAKPDHYLKTKDGVWVQKRDINRLKKDGKIGETWQGYLGRVDNSGEDDREITAVLELENSIRHDDYQRMARKRNVDVDQVAQETGKSNIDKLPAGEWYKGREGKWAKKK